MIADVEREAQFWERAALAAILVLLEHEDTTVAETSEMAAACADHLLVAWRERFAQPGVPS